MSSVWKSVITLIMIFSLSSLASAQEPLDLTAELDTALSRTFTAQDAARPLTTGGTYVGSHHTPIVCGPGQTVGLWINSRSRVIARNMTFQDCPIGIKVEDTDVEHRIEGMVVSGAIACIVSGGSRDRGCDAPRGAILNNTLTGCDFGIIKFGGSTQIFDNRITQNRLDGVVLGGDCNELRRNRITNNGRDGLVLPAKAIFFGPSRFLLRFLDLPRANVIVGNVINGNTVTDIRSHPRFPCGIRANRIVNNAAATIDTGCETDS